MLAGYGVHGIDFNFSHLIRNGLGTVVKQDRVQAGGLLFYVPTGTSPVDYEKYVPHDRLGDWYANQKSTMVDTISTDISSGGLLPSADWTPGKLAPPQVLINAGPASFLSPVSQSSITNPSTAVNGNPAGTNSIQGSSGQTSNSGNSTSIQATQQSSSPSYYAYNPTAGSVIASSTNPATATSSGGLESTLIGMLQGSGIDFTSIGSFLQSKLFGLVPVWLVGGAGVGYFMFKGHSGSGGSAYARGRR